MSAGKLTFTYPATGETMESTPLTRWISGPVAGLIMGLVLGVVFGVVIGLVAGLTSGADNGLNQGLCAGLVIGLMGGVPLGFWAALFGGLIVSELEEARKDRFIRWVHDGIACAQHRWRQRILYSQYTTQVPDTALSRAQPPGEPQPTDAALSLADTPDEKERLAASTDNSTEGEVSATR